MEEFKPYRKEDVIAVTDIDITRSIANPGVVTHLHVARAMVDDSMLYSVPPVYRHHELGAPDNQISIIEAVASVRRAAQVIQQ